jgi:diadenosine tetraphosphatase ApaH/serine/threonine PP2A family protein phosphatase
VSGPYPAEVFDRLSSLDRILFLRGNADRLVVGRNLEYDGLGAWCAMRLGDERLSVVSEWPLVVELEIDGLGRTLFCHAVPAADEPIFTRITPDEEVIRLLGDVDVELVVCGHTHVQFDRLLANGLRVANAGSVGMPYEGRRGAFWALLGSGVEFRRTTYDVEAAIASIRSTNAPVREQHIGWLLDPPDPDETSAFFESQRGA